jgi:two-component system sensor histidine kinase AlgZ
MRVKESQILSAFQPLPTPDARALPRQTILVFDACQAGVVLRAVLFVQAVLAVGAMFGVDGMRAWLERLAFLTGGTLPATLLWLLVACSFKRWFGRLGRGAHYPVGAALGMSAGLVACAILSLGDVSGSPPWLASAMAGSLLSVLLVLGLVLRARARTPAATTARLAELQARIRPHFLFNTLNSAIALVRAEPAKAERLLEDLADLFHHALVDQGESATLAQEIQLAERYLAIEQVRFGERLRVQWHLDPRAEHARLPPLLLQPLVENAVKHGVEPSQAGASVSVSSERRGNTVVVTVTNTVPAGQGAAGAGVALENVRARLALLHDVQGRFHAGLRNGVFEVQIEVPA